MLFLYARKEKTTDDVFLKHGGKTKDKTDAVLYTDKALTECKARIPWYHKKCPDRRYKYATINCYKYKIIWV